MNHASYPVKIFDINGLVLISNVISTILEGEESIFTILHGHEKIIAQLRIGSLILQFANNNNKTFSVYKGVAKFDGENLEIVSEFVIESNACNKDQIEDFVQSKRKTRYSY